MRLIESGIKAVGISGRFAATGLLLLSLIVPVTPAIGLPGAARDVTRDMNGIEDVMRGRLNVYYEITMTVHRKRWDRVMSMRAWDSRRQNASFIKITEPARDAGTAFLKKDNIFRQYIPRIKRTIRISPSMMLQSWMGSDFSNDDLARESSLTKDYDAKVKSTKACEGGATCIVYALTAKPDAPVVWPSMEIVATERYVPVRFTYYNSEGTALKEMRFSDVKTIQGRAFPHLWVMKNLTQDDQQTEIRFHRVAFDSEMSAAIFTDRNLTRGK